MICSEYGTGISRVMILRVSKCVIYVILNDARYRGESLYGYLFHEVARVSRTIILPDTKCHGISESRYLLHVSSMVSGDVTLPGM